FVPRDSFTVPVIVTVFVRSTPAPEWCAHVAVATSSIAQVSKKARALIALSSANVGVRLRRRHVLVQVGQARHLGDVAVFDAAPALGVLPGAFPALWIRQL